MRPREPAAEGDVMNAGKPSTQKLGWVTPGRYARLTGTPVTEVGQLIREGKFHINRQGCGWWQCWMICAKSDGNAPARRLT